jgi:hypothetical protein
MGFRSGIAHDEYGDALRFDAFMSTYHMTLRGVGCFF